MKGILYLLDKPIQNDLPYQLLANKKIFNVIVLCINKGLSSLAKVENLNESVFSDTKLYSFPYIYYKSSIQLFQSIQTADTIIVYGHYNFKFRLAIIFSIFLRKKLILTSDASSLQGSASSRGWKLKVKPILFRLLYNQISSGIFVPSSASKSYFEKTGIRTERICITPYTVNEQFILDCLLKSDIRKLRTSLSIKFNDVVFLFCGKLIQRKRAVDLLQAFASMNNSNAKMIIVGDGPLKDSLEALSTDLEISSKVIFAGLIPYEKLPAYYALASVLVIPASHEPYGLPVNEAMICGTPVIASDAVGAAQDLIEEGVTGFTYPVSKTNELANRMQHFINNPNLKIIMADRCRKKMESWSSASNVESQLDFFRSKGWYS